MYNKLSDNIRDFAKGITAKSTFVQQLKKELEEDPEFKAKVLDTLKNAKEVEALSKPAMFITILSLMATIWADGAKKMFQGGNFNDIQADNIMKESIVRGLKELDKKPQMAKSLKSLIKNYALAGIISDADAKRYFGVIDDKIKA